MLVERGDDVDILETKRWKRNRLVSLTGLQPPPVSLMEQGVLRKATKGRNTTSI